MRYMNVLANQWQRSQAWIMVTFLLGGLCVWLVVSSMMESRNMAVRLVPQEYDMTHGPVEVDRTATSNEMYLTLIATADIKNYTDWTPRTVENAIGRFVNRMTPRLYSMEGPNLMLTAEDRAGGARSQSFYLESSAVKENEVRLKGRLQIWQGQEQVSNNSIEYTIGYSTSDGIPKIHNFSAREAR